MENLNSFIEHKTQLIKESRVSAMVTKLGDILKEKIAQGSAKLMHSELSKFVNFVEENSMNASKLTIKEIVGLIQGMVFRPTVDSIRKGSGVGKGVEDEAIIRGIAKEIKKKLAE